MASVALSIRFAVSRKESVATEDKSEFWAVRFSRVKSNHRSDFFTESNSCGLSACSSRVDVREKGIFYLTGCVFGRRVGREFSGEDIREI